MARKTPAAKVFRTLRKPVFYEILLTFTGIRPIKTTKKHINRKQT